MKKNKVNNVSDEVKREYTDEFILLGILVLAGKYGHNLSKMQILKILQKFKQYLQDRFEIQAYHTQLIKWKHGDFDSTIYTKLSDLKKSDLISSQGTSPAAPFYATDFGVQVFDNIKMSTGEQTEKFNIVKSVLEAVVEKESHKDANQLRKENHARKLKVDDKIKTIEEIPEGEITTPNITKGDYFIFDDRLAIDWSLYQKIAERKRENVIPDEDIPESQEDIHRLLGLIK